MLFSGTPIEILEGLNEVLGDEGLGLKWFSRAINIAVNAMKPAVAVKNFAREGYFSDGADAGEELGSEGIAQKWSDTTILLSTLAWAAKAAGLNELASAIDWSITAVKAAEVGNTGYRQIWRQESVSLDQQKDSGEYMREWLDLAFPTKSDH